MKKISMWVGLQWTVSAVPKDRHDGMPNVDLREDRWTAQHRGPEDTRPASANARWGPSCARSSINNMGPVLQTIWKTEPAARTCHRILSFGYYCRLRSAVACSGPSRFGPRLHSNPLALA